MDDLTQRYYEAEMRYLREAGKEFAQAYPDRAAMLNLDKPGARDPYVERLFEGFAFLMGRLREKLDDDLPELTEGLVSLLWPHYLRTIPSLSVVELSTDHRQMKQSETLSDFQVLSRPVGERRTRCFYSATRDITLHPLALPDVSLQYEPDGRSVIRLRFECGPLVGDWSQIDLSRLPLYLNAGSPVACALHRALTLGTQQFWLRLPGQDRRTLDAHFSPLGFEDNDRLWPKGESAFSGYQLLLEYFTFREKFMFVALNGLELVAWPEGITGFEIDVVLNENWPHDLPFDSDNIRLHCVPVINLFPLEADPLHLSPLENEFLLRPMRIQDGHTEIYSVDNIISSRHTGSQAYVPFSSFRHRGGMLRHDAPERYYHTRVKRGPSGLHDTWLILGGDAFDADRMLEDETLSLSLTGTNGHLPRKALQSTLLDRPVHASQNVLRVRNLCAPTQPCYPSARDRFHWRVLSHLGSNFLSMMDNAEILRGTLALYDWTESEMNRRRLEAIVDVQHSLIQRFERGFLLRGVDIQVTLDSNGFAGEGDITLFGELLHRFFALYDGHDAVMAFLDIFNHRFITQYYRIWRKYNYPASFEAGAMDDISRCLLGLIGLGIPGSENHIATPVSRFLALLSVMRLPTRTAEGVTALVGLLAPLTKATVVPHDPQPVILPAPAGLSKNSRISLKTRTLLGRTGTDVNSQLLLKLYTEDAAEARGWLPGGQLHSDLLVLLRVYLGWRCQARLQLTLPVSLLPAARLGKQRVQISRTGILRASFAAPATGTVTVSLGRYQGLIPALSIRNRESMTHVSYSF